MVDGADLLRLVSGGATYWGLRATADSVHFGRRSGILLSDEEMPGLWPLSES